MTTTRSDGASPAETPGVAAEGSQAPPVARASGTSVEPYISGLRQLTRAVGFVAAPTALFSSLFYYFGWNYAYYLYLYFGVDSSVLGLTTGDYLLFSADALLVPITVGAFVGLFALWGHSELRAHIEIGARPGLRRILLLMMAGVGLALTTTGFVSVFTATILSRYLTAAPLSLAGGLLLLGYADRLRRLPVERGAEPVRYEGPNWGSVGQWAIVFVLVGVSLFWAATDYSASVGNTRARRFAAQLPGYPAVVIYSEKNLSLHAPGVRETACQDPKAAYHFRYDGLVLMRRAGDQYLFLPRAWTLANGAAILIPRDSSLRLEFVQAYRNLASPTC